MDFKKLYREKLITLDEAIDKVKDGDVIVAAQVAGEPVGLLSNLHKARGRVKDVKIMHSISMYPYEFFTNPAMKDTFDYEVWFYGKHERRAHPLQTVSYMPSHLRYTVRDSLSCNSPTVFWGTASPMDSHGNMSLSLGVVYEREMFDRADYVVLEVNKNLPRTFGDGVVNIRECDYVVENDIPLLEVDSGEITEIDNIIGKKVGELVEDGSTIQLGIGSLPNAIAMNFMSKKDLGVHTEMITDSVADLFDAGVITGRKKTLWPNKIIGSFIFGTRKIYDFVHNNAMVELKIGSVVNDPYVISRNCKMVSINSALQIDLTGQVCSESIGPRQISGTGGQSDTATGAQMSPEGKSIIALHSTSSDEGESRIVCTLKKGAAVTLHRNDVDYVVTEFGTVRLKGGNIRERAKALISIAHPKFREELHMEAQEMGFL